MVLRLRCYERLSVQNRRFRSNGAGWLKISGKRGRPHQPFFFLVNYAKWSFVWYKNLDRSFFRFVTVHVCDRRTDGRTDTFLIARPRLHSMLRGKNATKNSPLPDYIALEKPPWEIPVRDNYRRIDQCWLRFAVSECSPVEHYIHVLATTNSHVQKIAASRHVILKEPMRCGSRASRGGGASVLPCDCM